MRAIKLMQKSDFYGDTQEHDAMSFAKNRRLQAGNNRHECCAKTFHVGYKIPIIERDTK